MHWAQKIAIAKESREAGHWMREQPPTVSLWEMLGEEQAIRLRNDLAQLLEDRSVKYGPVVGFGWDNSWGYPATGTG